MLRLHCSLKYTKAVLEAVFAINVHYSSTWKEDSFLMTCHLRSEREIARLTFYKTRITFSTFTAIKKCPCNGSEPRSRPLPVGRCRTTLQVSSNLSLHPVGSRVIYIHDTHCRAHSFITCIEILLTLSERAPLLNFIHRSVSQRFWLRLPNSPFLLFQRFPPLRLTDTYAFVCSKWYVCCFMTLALFFPEIWVIFNNCELSIALTYATFSFS